ncbi:hypothetical protein SDC9_173933 [bioreactor metagenome]|uniref:Uncharacterized protein n=1 Tax=bioreactor metagenome TaxID=1076179 RepID=A0A645GHU5_9ZZZZ
MIKIICRESAGQQTSICGRWFCSSDSVSNRSRKGSGRLRPDPERSGIVDPGNGTAPISDLHDIHYRSHNGISGKIVGSFNAIFGRYFYFPIFNEGAFGGSTAHIERNQVVFSQDLTKNRSPVDTGYRTGFYHIHRSIFGLLKGCRPAIGLHNITFSLEANTLQFV